MKINRIGALAFIVFSISFVSCGEETKSTDAETEACPDLTALFSQVDQVRGAMYLDPFSWDACIPVLNSFLERLKENKDNASEECSFIDHRQGPGYDRFDFVTSIADKIVTTGDPQAIDILLKLSNLYADDEAITEFVGEELMKVAVKATPAYLEYYNTKPQLRKKLVRVTVWMPSKHEQVLKQLKGLPKSDPLHSLLKNRFAAKVNS